MEKEVKHLVAAGLNIPASFLKRSTWVKTERVMEFLAKKGLVERTGGEVKYRKTFPDVPETTLVRAYCKSPLVQHFEEYKRLGEDLHLPLNSGELLREFTNL